MIAVWTCRVLGVLFTVAAFAAVFGGAYLMLGAVGLALKELHVGPLHLMTGDHVFHVVLGSVVLLAGLFSGRLLS